MQRPRTDIAEQQGISRSQLALDIEIPVHDVRAFRVSIDETVSDLLLVETDVWIGHASSEDCSLIRPNDLEGGRGCCVQTKFIRQRQHIKHPKSSAHRRLAVLKWIPFQTNAAFEI